LRSFCAACDPDLSHRTNEHEKTDHVIVVDTTLRDGINAPARAWLHEKLQWRGSSKKLSCDITEAWLFRRPRRRLRAVKKVAAKSRNAGIAGCPS
jgi:isopropylmalate/homocitrate/citramalate synthase